MTIEEELRATFLEVYESFMDLPLFLVLFTSETCEKCPPMKEMYRELAQEYFEPEVIPFLQVDVDEYPELKERARIKAVPMVVLYKRGKVRDFLFGVPDADKLRKKIQMLRD